MSPGRRRLLLASALAGCIVAALFGFGRLKPGGSDAGERSLADAGPARPSPELRSPTGSVRPPRALPASLVGTEEDGALGVDQDGHFLPTPDAIDLFDYYLSAQGEESLEVIQARVMASIDRQLEGPAAAAARALFADYLRYREQAGSLSSGELVGEDLERRIQYVRELRREVFGSEVAAMLFGEQEARWFVDLERRRIAMDEDLAPEEKQRQLEALYSELPAEVRLSHQRSSAHTRLREDEAELRTRGAGPAEIDQLREERLGAAAAARLAALDADRARWQDRLERFEQERRLLEARTPAEDLPVRLEQLLAGHFDEREQIRVRALDPSLR
ncbi:MAG: lipase secretion chaperone [Myxococcota bacterium]|nr:lipase secretion chaperone [Myxococcota bacterium]